MKDWLLRIASALIILVAGLLLAELVVRLGPRRWFPEAQEPPRLNLGGLVGPSDNPRLYHELIPDPANGVNAAGFRGPLYPHAKPAGTRRVVGLGDSTFFGWRIREEEGTLRQLEGLARTAGRRVDVVNLAVPGYNTAQALEQLRTRGLAFDPDAIVLGYDHNDPEPPYLFRLPVSMLPDEYGDNPLGSRLWRSFARALRYRELRSAYPGRRDNRVMGALGRIFAGPAWDAHLEHLGAIARIAGSRGNSFVVVLWCPETERDPRLESRHYRMLHAPVIATVRAQGGRVVDAYALLQGVMAERDLANAQSFWVGPIDGHPNPWMHRQLALAVWQRLERDLSP